MLQHDLVARRFSISLSKKENKIKWLKLKDTIHRSTKQISSKLTSVIFRVTLLQSVHLHSSYPTITYIEAIMELSCSFIFLIICSIYYFHHLAYGSLLVALQAQDLCQVCCPWNGKWPMPNQLFYGINYITSIPWSSNTYCLWINPTMCSKSTVSVWELLFQISWSHYFSLWIQILKNPGPSHIFFIRQYQFFFMATFSEVLQKYSFVCLFKLRNDWVPWKRNVHEKSNLVLET